VDELTLADRKVGQKNLNIVEFVGTPPPSASIGMWAMLRVRASKEGALSDLVIDARRFKGGLQLVLPPPIFPKEIAKQAKGFKLGSKAVVDKWFKSHAESAKRLFHDAKYPAYQYQLLTGAMKRVSGQRPLVLQGGGVATIRELLIPANDEQTIFIRIDPPRGAKIGSVFEFDVSQRDSKQGLSQGGARYRVVINRKAT
jgi:hypothetical protein